MSDVVAFVFSIGGAAVAMAALGLWLWRSPSSRTPRRLLLWVAASYLALSTYAVPYVLSRALVIGYKELTPADLPRGRVAIVVLAGGIKFLENWRGEAMAHMDEPTAARVWEAYRVYRFTPNAWVISSEGSRPMKYRGTAGAAMRDELIRLGVPASRIVTETEAQNTHDESLVVARLLRSLPVDRVVLVTWDLHMRRSIGTFRAAGIDAVPAIARDPGAARPWTFWLMPSDAGLGLSGSLFHELIGLVEYRARGWLRS
jgi:uncharacterized SAM-binding protein YcdF (DUF218 family)